MIPFFQTEDGLILCGKDYLERPENLKTTCASCYKPLGREAVAACDRYWHPECFECAVCQKQIEADENYFTWLVDRAKQAEDSSNLFMLRFAANSIFHVFEACVMMLVDVATQRAEFPVVSREVASEDSSFRTPPNF